MSKFNWNIYFKVSIYILVLSVVILIIAIPIMYSIGNKECESSGRVVQSEISRVGAINTIDLNCE